MASAFDKAVERLSACDGDLAKLSVASQTVLIVHAAQGLIDNGGLEYFFESDFPGQPSYAVFCDAYRRIGADEAAKCLGASVRAFGFDAPHLSREKRRAFIASLPGDLSHPFRQLSDRLCGDRSVWSQLCDYIEHHREALGLA